MTAILISSYPQYPFGQQTNTVVARLITTQGQINRIAEAIATASTGFAGTPGTQFEVGNTTGDVPNLFGVSADATNPGVQGEAYRYAVEQLAAAWSTFWTAAQPFIEAIDNGAQAM